eukprot:14454330-Alexandrium_andersonii.AAC.1
MEEEEEPGYEAEAEEQPEEVQPRVPSKRRWLERPWFRRGTSPSRSKSSAAGRRRRCRRGGASSTSRMR